MPKHVYDPKATAKGILRATKPTEVDSNSNSNSDSEGPGLSGSDSFPSVKSTKKQGKKVHFNHYDPITQPILAKTRVVKEIIEFDVDKDKLVNKTLNPLPVKETHRGLTEKKAIEKKFQKNQPNITLEEAKKIAEFNWKMKKAIEDALYDFEEAPIFSEQGLEALIGGAYQLAIAMYKKNYNIPDSDRIPPEVVTSIISRIIRSSEFHYIGYLIRCAIDRELSLIESSGKNLEDAIKNAKEHIQVIKKHFKEYSAVGDLNERKAYKNHFPNDINELVNEKIKDLLERKARETFVQIDLSTSSESAFAEVEAQNKYFKKLKRTHPDYDVDQLMMRLSAEIERAYEKKYPLIKRPIDTLTDQELIQNLNAHALRVTIGGKLYQYIQSLKKAILEGDIKLVALSAPVPSVSEKSNGSFELVLKIQKEFLERKLKDAKAKAKKAQTEYRVAHDKFKDTADLTGLTGEQKVAQAEIAKSAYISQIRKIIADLKSREALYIARSGIKGFGRFHGFFSNKASNELSPAKKLAATQIMIAEATRLLALISPQDVKLRRVSRFIQATGWSELKGSKAANDGELGKIYRELKDIAGSRNKDASPTPTESPTLYNK